MPRMASFRHEVSGVDFPSYQAVAPDLERATVDRARTGDQQALADLYDWYMPRVYKYVVARVGNPAEAEDLTEEVFLKMLGAIGGFRWREVPFSSWIFRIARNFCFMKRRKSAFAPAQEISLDELKPAFKTGLADWRALPDKAAESKEMRALLERAIAALPDLYKNVLLLRDLEELSVKETAGILDVSEDVVKTRLHRARLAVRKQIDEYLREGAASI